LITNYQHIEEKMAYGIAFSIEREDFPPIPKAVRGHIHGNPVTIKLFILFSEWVQVGFG
jgi:hypothetical protein